MNEGYKNLIYEYLQQGAQQLLNSLPSSVVERVTSNDEVVSSILAEGITFC